MAKRSEMESFEFWVITLGAIGFGFAGGSFGLGFGSLVVLAILDDIGRSLKQLADETEEKK